MSGEEFEVEITAMARRRAFRDFERLRAPKRAFLRNFADDTQEWVLQEIKDELIVIEYLKAYNIAAVNMTILPIEAKVKEIRKSYVRKVISPIRKIEKAKMRDEKEHWMRFRQIIEPAIDLIEELLSNRPLLEAAVNQSAGADAASKFRPPYIG